MTIFSENIGPETGNRYDMDFRWTALFIVISCIGLCLVYAPTLYSLSVDVAHHYALVATIMRDWRVGPELLPNLGEMNFYPNLSHWLSAMVGGLMGSGLAGMTILSIAALTITWATAGALLREFGLPSAIAGGGILVFFVSRFGLGSAHGDEIVGNFFFAQLVGESAFYLAGWCLFSLHRRDDGNRGDVIVPLFVYFVTWIHLLPALKLVALFGLLTTIEFIQAIRARGNLPWSRVLSVFISAIIVLNHPSFAAMKMIAANDGTLSFKYPDQIKYIIAFALLLISLIFMMRTWSNTKSFRISQPKFALGFIGCLGATTAGVMLMQAAALYLTGAGSSYAVKKHMFGVHSMLLIVVTVLLMLPIRFVASELFPVRTPGKASQAKRLGHVLVPAALPVAMLWATMPHQGFDIVRILPYQRFATHYLDYHSGDVGSDGTLFIHEAVPSVVSYLVTVGDLRHPRGETTLKVLAGHRVWEAQDASRVITNPQNAFYDRFDCRIGGTSNGTTVVVDQDCVRRASDITVGIGNSFSFRSGAEGTPFLLDGWSQPEQWGTWSTGSAAEIRVPVPASRQPFSIELEVIGFHPPGSDPVAVTVRLGDEAPSRYSIGAQDATIRVDVPESLADTQSPIRIGFEIANPRSPRELGLSVDGRPLGIGLKKITYLK